MLIALSIWAIRIYQSLTHQPAPMPQKDQEIMDKARPSSLVKPVDKKTLQRFLKANESLTPAISPLWMNSAMPSASRSRLTWLWLRRCGFWYRHPTQQQMDDFAVAPGA